jgi:hypothetical protein
MLPRADEKALFMASIGFGLERLGLLAIRWPRAAALVVVAITLSALYGCLHLQFEEDLRNIFRSESPAWTRYQDFGRNYNDGQGDVLMVAEADTFADPLKLEALRNLHLELQLVEGVGQVFSVLSLRAQGASSGRPPLIGSALDRAGLEAVFALADSHPLARPAMLSADRKLALILASPDKAHESGDAQDRFIVELRQTVASLGQQPIKVAETGAAVMRYEIVRLLFRDQLVFNIAGAALGLVLSFIIFRSFAAALIVVLPGLLAAIMVLGAMGLAGVPMNAVTNVIPVLVMVLGYADSMHLTHIFYQTDASSQDWRQRARAANQLAGPACALTALTTAAAFISLAFSQTEIVRGFGLVGAFATLTTFVTVIVLHPLLSAILGPLWLRNSARRFHAMPALTRVSIRCVASAVAWPRTVILLAVVSAIALASAYMALLPAYSLQENLSTGHPAMAAFTRAEQALGGVLPLNVMVPLVQKGTIGAGEMQHIRAAHRVAAGIAGERQVISPWSLVTDRDNTAVAATAVNAILAGMPLAARNRFIATDGTSVLLTVFLPQIELKEGVVLIDRIEAAVASAVNGPVTVTGPADLTIREAGGLIRWLNINLFLAIVLSIGVIALAFRSLTAGLICLLPNILPVLATAGFIYVMGQRLHFSSIMAFTIAFGIAVDDTIHFLRRYHLNVLQHRNTLDAINESARKVGPVMIATTLVLIGGIGITGVSELPMVRLFGMLAIVLLLAALVADLIILPSLLVLISRHKVLTFALLAVVLAALTPKPLFADNACLRQLGGQGVGGDAVAGDCGIASDAVYYKVASAVTASPQGGDHVDTEPTLRHG